MHVCRSTEYRRARRRLELQRLLVGAHGLAETTLRNPYIRQGHGATECVGVVPGPLQTGHASGIRLVRWLEIPARPRCQAEQRGGGSTAKMIVLRSEVQRPPGILHGAGHIAQHQSEARTVDGDRTRESAELPFVHDDHLGWRGFRSATRVCRRIQPPLGVAQARVNARELAASH